MPQLAGAMFHIVAGGPVAIAGYCFIAFLGGLCVGFAFGRYHAKWGGSF